MKTEVLRVDPSTVQAAELAPALELLRDGHVIALPTETVYGVAALADHEERRVALERLKGRREGQELTVAVASEERAAELADWSHEGLRRLAARYWPGPLTLIAPRRDGTGRIGLRVPAHAVPGRLLQALKPGLYLTSANPTGEPPATDAEQSLRYFDGKIPLIIDGGPASLGEASAVVSFEGRRAIVHRSSLIDRRMVLDTAATHVLMVCTGNTCRSPMAEVLFRREWARRRAVSEEDLLEHGGKVSSAGISAVPGITASPEAVEVLARDSVDLRPHRSRQLTEGLVRSAHHVFTMTGAHLLAVKELVPDLAGRVELLDPRGIDLEDPIGGGLDVYVRCMEEILEAVRRRLDHSDL